MSKSANMRVALLPYPVIAAAVGGNPKGNQALFQLHSRIIYEDKL